MSGAGRMRAAGGRLALVLMVAGPVLLVTAGVNAIASVGLPFPSLLVDPWADYSVVYLPSWRGVAPGAVRAADRLIAVDGVAIRRPADDFPARQLESFARGSPGPSLALTFIHEGAPQTWAGPLRQFEFTDVWWLFGFYALLGSLFLWAAVLVLRSGLRRPAGLVFAAASVVSFLFLGTFFDYHSGRTLSPVFAFASFALIPSVLALAVCFPRPPALPRLAMQALSALLGLLVLGAIVSALATWMRVDLRWLRQLVNVALAPSFAILAGSMLIRLRARDTAVRREVRVAAWGLVVAPASVSALVLMSTRADDVSLHLVLPLLGLVVPASIGVSVLRFDVFDTGSIVRPTQVALPVGLFALVIAGSTVAGLGASGGVALVTGLLAAVTVVTVIWPVLMRWLFPSRLTFRPIVEKLAAEVRDLRDESQLRERLLASVERALPGRPLTLVLGSARPKRQPNFTGQEFVLRSDAHELGVLTVGRRSDRALLTQSDLALVEVLCVVSSLALESFGARRALEAQRVLEADAGRTDKRLSVDTLAAEVAHELAYPLSYFRHFLGRLETVHHVPARDLEVGLEEVARLERMVSTVRRFQAPSPRMETIRLASIIARAQSLIAEDTRALEQAVGLEIAPELELFGDGDLALQLFANLLRNASQAAGAKGRLGARATLVDREVHVAIWDDGPGLTAQAEKQLFKPFFSTRPDGSGLGLSICHRIVRTLGWSIDAAREGDLTTFTVVAPRSRS